MSKNPKHEKDLSWDDQLQTAPERPHFVSNLVDSELIARPKRVIVAFIFVVLGLIIIVATNILALNNLEGLRDSLLSALPDEITEEYDEEDRKLAINILLGAVAGLLLFVSLVLAMSSTTVLRHRSKAARVMFVIFGLLYLPVAFVAMVIREGGDLDLWLTVLTVFLFFLATVFWFTPRVSQWLTQKEDTRPIPIAPGRSANTSV